MPGKDRSCASSGRGGVWRFGFVEDFAFFGMVFLYNCPLIFIYLYLYICIYFQCNLYCTYFLRALSYNTILPLFCLKLIYGLDLMCLSLTIFQQTGFPCLSSFRVSTRCFVSGLFGKSPLFSIVSHMVERDVMARAVISLNFLISFISLQFFRNRVYFLHSRLIEKERAGWKLFGWGQVFHAHCARFREIAIKNAGPRRPRCSANLGERQATYQTGRPNGLSDPYHEISFAAGSHQ